MQNLEAVINCAVYYLLRGMCDYFINCFYTQTINYEWNRDINSFVITQHKDPDIEHGFHNVSSSVILQKET